MQESGLTEIITLICTSAIWGQYPVFSHPEFPQGASLGVAAVSDELTMSIQFPFWVPSGHTIQKGDVDDIQNLMAWWLQNTLCLPIWQAAFFSLTKQKLMQLMERN